MEIDDDWLSRPTGTGDGISSLLTSSESDDVSCRGLCLEQVKITQRNYCTKTCTIISFSLYVNINSLKLYIILIIHSLLTFRNRPPIRPPSCLSPMRPDSPRDFGAI